MHKFLLDGISENMSALVQNEKSVAINTVDPTIMGYYVVKFLAGPYMLQDHKKIEKQFITAVEVILKVENLNIIKANTNWYWKQPVTKDSFIMATCTIVHSCLDVSTVKNIEYIPRI